MSIVVKVVGFDIPDTYRKQALITYSYVSGTMVEFVPINESAKRVEELVEKLKGEGWITTIYVCPLFAAKIIKLKEE